MTQPNRATDMGPQDRHLIAINCHPFHSPQSVTAGLAAVADAAALLQRETRERVETRLFWHSDARCPAHVQRRAQDLGIDISHFPHQSNGANLNRQIAYAASHDFTFFYRVDGDDLVFLQRFLLQANHLKRGRCDVCGAGLRYEPERGAPYEVTPAAEPGCIDFLENRFMLHPSMALRVAAITRSGLRYWPHRLEDKAFLADAVAAGLRLSNLPVLVGTYRVGRRARRGVIPAALALRLNCRFLARTRGLGLLPYAVALCAAQLLLGPHLLRGLRQWRYGKVRTRLSAEPAKVGE